MSIKDVISSIGIDESGSLWIKPATRTFPYVYREAMEVNWDEKRQRLYGPSPRQWSYLDWFKQIRDAARQQGVDLAFHSSTGWLNVEPELRCEIEALDR